MRTLLQDKLTYDLQAAISAVCPNAGVYISKTGAPGFNPAKYATQEQLAAAEKVLKDFPIADYQPGGSIYKLEECYDKRRAAYPPIGDQLDAILKALDSISKVAAIALPTDTINVIASCEAVKAEYPKP